MVTYRELAERTGWSLDAIGEYLSGRAVPPADGFGVLVRSLGAAADEQRALATARDRVEERMRGPGGHGQVHEVRLGGPLLVGRQSEMAALRAAVEGVRSGLGGVVFLVGEAGIGKTRLVGEVTRLAEQAGLRVLRGRAATPAVQFRPIAEALLSMVRNSGPPEDAELIPYRPALSRLIPEWHMERPAGEDDSLVVLAEAVLRLLVTLGRPHGCLLVLEDLHDADTDTLMVVDYLVDNLAREPVLLLGTLRTEPSPAFELAHTAWRRRTAQTIELGRLADDEVRQLAGLCLDTPVDDVPEPVLERLLSTADGIPLHVEELLAGMVSDRLLVRGGRRWVTSGPISGQLPVRLVTTLSGRTDGLSTPTRELLLAAALLGGTFPVETVGAAVGLADDTLLVSLREAIDAQVLVSGGDGCSFRHALTAEALRARLLPIERAALSRSLAEAAELTMASEDGQQLAAELWCAAGEHRRAAELFGAAGRRAAAQGAVSTAISLLERALSLAVDTEPTGIVEALVGAYADAGRIAEAYALGDRFREAPHRVAVCLRLAKVAAAAGDWTEGLRAVDEVRRLLGARADPATTAEVDAIAAQLTFGNPTPDRVSAARRLAERALRAVDVDAQPDVACVALETLGRCARLRDLAESDALYERGLAIARAHNLVSRKIGLLYNIGAHDGIRRADPCRLVEALSSAREAGAVVTALDIELELAVVRLCRGEYDEADESTRRCEEAAERLRLTHTRLIALGERIIVAAHRGRRVEVDDLVARFHEIGGDEDDFSAAVGGFGLAVCLLLEERRDQALDQLRHTVAQEARHPASYLSYTPGPHLLLSVLAGEAGVDECTALERSAQAEAGWNRLFLSASKAVLHGRAGRHGDATAAMDAFVAQSQPYPLAHHLGLRLVAESAIEHGWGDPTGWLRIAQTYFHPTSPAVSTACRVLLRRTGALVPQHRSGSADIPEPLRAKAVTVREYEVLRLVAKRLGNHEIAQRLFLSPRTVEKHVANLLAKTGQPDRATLAEFAADVDG
jgi:DNA-binding CsgD family transcriptional regulator/tetratricopeptide (TPR) repeat protein